MDLNNYYGLINNYSFKALVKRACLYEQPSKHINIQRIHGNGIATTDQIPCNEETIKLLLMDSSEIRYKQSQRKNISNKEFEQLCKLRNAIKPLCSEKYDKENPFNSLIAISRSQNQIIPQDSLETNLYRDFYIFTKVDDFFRNDPIKFLDTVKCFYKETNTPILDSLASSTAFYEHIFQTKKRLFAHPQTENEVRYLTMVPKSFVYNPSIGKKINLILNPVIRIGRDYFIPSISFLYSRLGNYLYWEIRNYYKNNYVKGDKNKFPNNFGYYFEKYVFELLKSEKEIKNIEKITPVQEKETPDYSFLEFENDFVIECKSCLAYDKDNEKQFTDSNFTNEIEEAFRQLKNYRDEKCIKIVLLYEPRLPLIEFFERKIKKKLSLSPNYWLVNIGEFEAFIGIKSKYKFYDVIKSMLSSREIDDPISLSHALKIHSSGLKINDLLYNYGLSMLNSLISSFK